ncbi:MAG: DUF4912 domain-containing protein, partial [Cyanobacteriota bacterium]|nr:DUF4912 domain-containing protein [Cyanobacteriota bacterium]
MQSEEISEYGPVAVSQTREMSNNPVVNLASMSLRQLRDMARAVGILRYSSENREQLTDAITDKVNNGSLPLEDLAAIEAEMAPAPRPAQETRVVFLPRDPQWAYVFWEISDEDRE